MEEKEKIDYEMLLVLIKTVQEVKGMEQSRKEVTCKLQIFLIDAYSIELISFSLI